MTVQSLAENALLSRVALARALTEAGFPISASTLAQMASRGTGPKRMKWLKRCVYRYGDALEWANRSLLATEKTAA